MISIPTLNDLAAHPEQATDLSPHAVTILLTQLASLQTVLLGRLVTGMPHEARREDVGEDRLLLVGEASSMLGMTKDYLYKHADQLPFTVRPAPKQLRFSKLGILKFIRQRQGK